MRIIIARQHGGESGSENPALSCLDCNRRKGPNLTGIDPVSRAITRLYHPRKDRWNDHFQWKGAQLLGTTAVGRTTVMVLDLNRPLRVLVRASLLIEGAFPPKQDRHENTT